VEEQTRTDDEIPAVAPEPDVAPQDRTMTSLSAALDAPSELIEFPSRQRRPRADTGVKAWQVAVGAAAVGALLGGAYSVRGVLFDHAPPQPPSPAPQVAVTPDAPAPTTPTAPEPPAPEAPATVALNVHSQPAGARVLLDGVEAGVTPLSVPFNVGTQTEVRVEKTGYEAQHTRVTLHANKTLEWTLKKETPVTAAPEKHVDKPVPKPVKAKEQKPKKKKSSDVDLLEDL
jgi:hypothetical protein